MDATLTELDARLQAVAALTRTGDLSDAEQAGAALHHDLVTGLGDRRDDDSRWLRVRVLTTWAGVACVTGRLEAGMDRYQQAIDQLVDLLGGSPARAEHYRSALVDVCAEASKVAVALGETDRAHALLALAAGSGPGSGDQDAVIAAAAHLPGRDWAEVEERLRSALDTVTRPETIAELEFSLGELCAKTGRGDEALRLYRRCRRHVATSPTPQPWLSRIDLAEAAVALDVGDLATTEVLLTSAAPHLNAVDHPHDRSVLLILQAKTALGLGRPEEARQLLETAEQEPHPTSLDAGLWETMMIVLLEMGDLSEAGRRQTQWRESLSAYASDDVAFFELTQVRLERALLDAGEGGVDEVESHRTRAIITALALDSLRFELGTGHARQAWMEWADEAWQHAFEAAAASGNAQLVLELVDLRAVSGQLSPTQVHRPGAIRRGRTTAPVGSGVALGLPPQVADETGRRSLEEYVDLAASHFDLPIRSDRVVRRTPPPDAGAIPTMHLRLADAGDTYLAWTWSGSDEGPGVAICPADRRAEAVALWRAAAPDQQPGEGPRDALERALTGPLVSLATEQGLMAELALRLLPGEVVVALSRVAEQGQRPLVRIQPSPSLSSVPWPLLSDHEGNRLLDLADVETASPLGVQPPDVTARRWTVAAPRILVIDPRVPGFRADSELGSVLGRPDPDAATHRAATRVLGRTTFGSVDEVLRSTVTDRTWLAARLTEGPGSLVYVGHVTSSGLDHGQSEDTALHLADSDRIPGFADPVRTHRPFTATDLLLGDAAFHADGASGPERWPAPPRVAILGCRSGGESGCVDAYGVASAFLHNGAERVLATRWTLPTDHALTLLDGPVTARPFDALAASVIDLMDAPDPNLGPLLRARLAAWRAEGRLTDSPLWWGALTWVTC